MGLLKNFGADKSMMCPVYGITEAMVVACGAPGKGIGSINLNRRQLSIGVEIEETMDRENGITFAELGYPPSGCNVRICDDADCILESGRVGHIQVSGPNVMPGYYKNEEETKKVFTQDGWYRTGDIGFIKDGKVTITGRAKEMVIVNMINYYLFDIERTAESIEGIRPGTVSACGALNKETMSDDIYLFVLFEGEVKDFVDIAKSIKIQIKNRIGLDVKRVIPTKNVPRTGLGKINRQMLKGMFDEGKFEGIVEELENLINEKTESRIIDVPQSEIEEKLSKIWMKILGVKSVGINDNFFELGGQSIKVPELAAEIANEFNVEVHLRVLYENPTIKSIAESIKSLR